MNWRFVFVLLVVAVVLLQGLAPANSRAGVSKAGTTDVAGRALLIQGLLLASKKQYQESIQRFDEALAINPDSIDALGERAMAKLALKRYQEAIEDFSAAITGEATAESLGYLYTGRGLCFSGLGRVDEALSDLNEAVEIAPSLGDSWFQRSVLLYRIGHPRAALKDIDRALTTAPGEEDYTAHRARLMKHIEELETQSAPAAK
jgi:tetratricopeptide (TPR) repeat protein